MKTTITFLGTSAVLPEPTGDTACLAINERILVDCGWNSAVRMRRWGLRPENLDYLILTHGHQDHYLGLPHLLFFRAMARARKPSDPSGDERHAAPAGGPGPEPETGPPLRVLGPEGDAERIVRLAMGFLQPKRFPAVCERPEVSPIRLGDAFECEEFRLETVAAVHPIQAMSFRFTDRSTGSWFVYSGDTAYNPALVELARGAPLLIHEASFGPHPARPENPSLHSGAPDAARVALEAGVERLALVHGPEEGRAAALGAARHIFPATFWPNDGEAAVL